MDYNLAKYKFIRLVLLLLLSLAMVGPVVAQVPIVTLDWNTSNNTAYSGLGDLNGRSVTATTNGGTNYANTGRVYSTGWEDGSSTDWNSNAGDYFLFDNNFGNSFYTNAITSAGAETVISFGSSVTDPYVLINYVGDASYDFSGNVGSVVLATSTSGGTATLSGGVVTASFAGVEGRYQGFAVQLIGTFTSVRFTATSSALNDTDGVTIAIPGYSVTTSVGANGSGQQVESGDALAASSTTTYVVEANDAETLSYTFTAATNYKLDTANSTSSCGGTLAASYTTSAITANCSISVAFIEAVAPTLSSSTPADGTTGVAVGSNIALTFSENIQAGTGNITLYDSGDNLVEAFDVTTDVTISGATVTLDPANDLSSLTGYYVQVAATAIDDAAGNSFDGISDKTTLNFTTADVVGPTLSSSSPSDGATGVAVGANIVLTFSENVQAGTGNIVISDGASDTRTIAIGSKAVVH